MSFLCRYLVRNRMWTSWWQQRERITKVIRCLGTMNVYKMSWNISQNKWKLLKMKSQGITKLNRIHPMGTMNVWTKWKIDPYYHGMFFGSTPMVLTWKITLCLALRKLSLKCVYSVCDCIPANVNGAHLTWASISLRSASLYRGRYFCRIRRACCLKMAVMYTVLSTAETGLMKTPYTKITPSSAVVPAGQKTEPESIQTSRLLCYLKPSCYLCTTFVVSVDIKFKNPPSTCLLPLWLWAVLHQQVVRL